MANGKITIIFLTVGLIKKISFYIKVNYFPEPHNNINKAEVELD